MQINSKNELRKQIKQLRKAIENKSDKDAKIASNLIKLDDFKNAGTIICYASYKDEIETSEIINYCFENGKRVAMPYCTDTDGNMDFYYINSLDDLIIGSFNIREPNMQKCEKMTDFKNTLCILPGLCFDKNGNRLGYGKGYYDRFLEKHTFKTVGLCYNTFVLDSVPIDVHDKPVNYVITETNVITTDNGEA